MGSVRDYITGRIRFPGGPQSSCGEDDVQVVDNVDMIFGDSEALTFGDDKDVSFAWDGSNLNILPLTDLTGAILIGNGTLSMDLKVFGTEAANYLEFDASEDRLNLVITTRTITGEDHALDISYAGVCASGGSDAMVGVNVAVAPTVTGAGWVSAFFGKVTEVAAAPGPVSGDVCAAEFEINLTGSQPCAYGVLVLNSNAKNSTYGQFEAYIWLREYGTKAVRHMIWFGDTTRASASDSIILSQMPQTPFDTAVRCMVGTTDFWLYGSTVGPASIADFKWIGSAATNYIEYDASGDVLNVVAADVTITGEHHALSVTHTGTISSGEGIVGVNAVVTPKGTAGQWASAFFGKVEISDANNSIPGTGYASGAEFEVTLGSGITPCDVGILTLNDGISCAHYAGAAYIRLMKYGSTWPINLFNFYHEATNTAYNSGRMVVATGDYSVADFDVMIRCIVGGTPIWIVATTVTPKS